MKKIKLNQGFTLIELLVVITLISILAVAVLATINPIEQIRKGRDTSTKSIASQYLSAQERFFTNYGCYTFDLKTTTGNTPIACSDLICENSNTISSNLGKINTVKCNSALVEAQEVKQSLINRITQAPFDAINIYVDGEEGLHASFKPESTTFDTFATWPTTCESGTAGDVYCVPDTVQ